MSLHFELARPAHEAALRRILRETAMPGHIRLATTREPDYFAAGDLLGKEYGVIAVDYPSENAPYYDNFMNDGIRHAIGMCQWREQRVQVQGRTRTAHYLGGLRVLPSHQKRLSVLKGGFAAVRRHGPAAPALWYTSIAADNANARRLLEAGLKGLPRYALLGELWTLAVPARRFAHGKLWAPVPAENWPQWCNIRNQYAARYEFSSSADAAYIKKLGIQPCAIWRQGEHGPHMAAHMAIWPQNAFKQTRVMGYDWPLRTWRPLHNAWARLTRGAPLPAAGQALDAAFMAFWSWSPDSPWPLHAQIRAACALCPADWLFVGVPAGSDLGPLARVPRYETRIYQVLFEGDQPLPTLTRPLLPEVAWL